MKTILGKKILSLEKKYKTRPKGLEFWVLIRREPHWFADNIPMPISSIVQGSPDITDFASVMTNEAYAPFNTRKEAEAYRIRELKKLKAEQPERFKKLEEQAEFIRYPAEYEKYRQPIIPEEVTVNE
jgi:hypothetical protein